jgi:nucleotide-binding universal stress UspA family protein
MQDGSRFDQVPSLQQAQYRAGCHRLLADQESPDDRIHVDQGPAELLIPQVAQRIEAKLVIVGTVARSGLQGVLLGNTAEQVLGRLNSDILVLPPN